MLPRRLEELPLPDIPDADAPGGDAEIATGGVEGQRGDRAGKFPTTEDLPVGDAPDLHLAGVRPDRQSCPFGAPARRTDTLLPISPWEQSVGSPVPDEGLQGGSQQQQVAPRLKLDGGGEAGEQAC